MTVRFGWVLAVVATLGAGLAPPLSAQPAGPVVMAVESLKPALDAIAAAWVAKGGRAVTFVYGPSGVLAARRAGGAPVDIVLSDDPKEMDALAKAGLIAPGTRRPIIGNDLVLVAPAGAPVILRIASGFNLAAAVGDGRLALCAPATCPAGHHGQAALETLKAWNAVQPKLVRGPDEASTLGMVGQGGARFGIVFAASARADTKVRVVDTFPVSTYPAVRYAVALSKASRSPDAAAFVAYLRSSQATRILDGLGFAVLP